MRPVATVRLALAGAAPVTWLPARSTLALSGETVTVIAGWPQIETSTESPPAIVLGSKASNVEVDVKTSAGALPLATPPGPLSVTATVGSGRGLIATPLSSPLGGLGSLKT